MERDHEGSSTHSHVEVEQPEKIQIWYLKALKSSTSLIRVTRISELGTSLAVTNNVPSSLILVTLMMEAICSSETSALTTATWHNIPEDSILHRTFVFMVVINLQISSICGHRCN
jgi:hypothetical protein